MKISQITTIMIVLLAVLVVQVSAQSFNYEPGVVDPTSLFLNVTDVDINDFDDFPSRVRLERGEEIKVVVAVKAMNGDVENARIRAEIVGYEYADYENEDVVAYSEVFDLSEGSSDTYTLHLKVPEDIEKIDEMFLRVFVSARNDVPSLEYMFPMEIDGLAKDKAVQIRKFYISPSSEIEAGRALSFKVQVKNMGEKDLDDVSVEISIPELGLTTYETIDTILEEEVESFEALLLRIPLDAEVKDYDVVATVSFDKYQAQSETKTITVTGREETPGSEEDDTTIITMPQSVEIIKGTTAVYPVLIENTGATSKTYIVNVEGTNDWATMQIQPSSVVLLKAGQTQTVYVNLQATADAEAGDKVFQVKVTAGDEVSSTNVLATVKAGEETSNNLRSVLEWALVILVIILILLGLIVLIAKVKKGDKEEDEDSETYY
ncbi:putative S-layer protein [Candidatus Woesearchaeota archaeon]|nr:putative S-layer protein [Candidatus Woesearchaeota archaeon]